MPKVLTVNEATLNEAKVSRVLELCSYFKDVSGASCSEVASFASGLLSGIAYSVEPEESEMLRKDSRIIHILKHLPFPKTKKFEAEQFVLPIP